MELISDDMIRRERGEDILRVTSALVINIILCLRLYAFGFTRFLWDCIAQHIWRHVGVYLKLFWKLELVPYLR